jgi:hypothetical protein
MTERNASPASVRAKSKKMSAVVTSGTGSSISGTVLSGGSSISGQLAQRKGASMVGLRLADLNQHLCTAMFGVVLGECHPCANSEKVGNKKIINNQLPFSITENKTVLK